MEQDGRDDIIRKTRTWIVAGTWTRTGNVDGKKRDNPKGKVPRARSRDTRHERGQDVNVDGYKMGQCPNGAIRTKGQEGPKRKAMTWQSRHDKTERG